MLITSVRDTVADRYLGFQLVADENVAIRGFKMALADALDKREGLYFYYPGDFDLYVVGEFDESTGIITGLDNARLLYRGSSHVVVNSMMDGDVDDEF